MYCKVILLSNVNIDDKLRGNLVNTKISERGFSKVIEEGVSSGAKEGAKINVCLS